MQIADNSTPAANKDGQTIDWSGKQPNLLPGQGTDMGGHEVGAAAGAVMGSIHEGMDAFDHGERPQGGSRGDKFDATVTHTSGENQTSNGVHLTGAVAGVVMQHVQQAEDAGKFR